MLHELLFLFMYLGLLPMVLVSPFVGVLLYHWLDDLPPTEVYSVTLVPGYIALVTGALTFVAWIFVEKKTLPRPLLITLLMVALLVWVNVTWFFALAPQSGQFEWDRTIKVIGFSILTAQMLSTRARLEAFVWVLVLAAAYFAIPGAIKLIVSGGSSGIGAGETVVAAYNSFFSERVIFSVVLAMSLPFALYLGRRTTLLPSPLLTKVKPAMLVIAGTFLLALIGTFARTGLLAGGAALLMLVARSERKIISALTVAGIIVGILLLAPESWFGRMDTISNYQNDDSATSRLAAWKWSWQMALEHPIVGGGFGVFVLNAGSIPGRSGWLEAHNIFFSIMGAHGFVGLGLFCCLILATYNSCRAIQKRAREDEKLAWAADLARATQVAIVAYCVGGMFVSIATTPFLYSLAAITVGTQTLVFREEKSSARQGIRGATRTVPQPTA